MSAGDNTFHTGDVSPRTGCGGPGGLPDGATFHLGPINNSVGRMQKLETDATKLHTRGAYDRVEIGSCRVAGADEEGPEWGEIIDSTRSILYPTLCAISWLGSPSPLRRGRPWRRGLPAQLAGRDRGSPPEERSVGRTAGRGPVLLAARFFPEPDAHGRDEGSPLATAVFGQEEGHVAVR